MDLITQYSVNLAMEATMALFLTFLLITCVWQKKLFSTTVPLIFLLGFNVLTHIEHIAMWIMFICDVLLKYGATPLRIVYIIDYILLYATSLAFYYYIEALVKEGYKDIDVVYEPNRHVHALLSVWGIVSSLVYSVLIFVPSLYHIENGIEISNPVSYVGLHIIIKFAVICSIALIIRHKKVISNHDAVLSVSFLILISIFSIIDDEFRLCISYLLLSLLIFILYVRIDLHKGILLERQEKEITEWKMQIMMSQMQPHFIYNVLTTISSMCEMQNAIQARDVVNKFADYLRANIDSIGKEKTIPFERELEHVKTYLWLEKVRFEDMININYDIKTTEFAVPQLSIQPIVENAVKHGILPKGNPGTVNVKSYDTVSEYVVVVEDDGVGFDVNEKPDDGRTRVGIDNVTNRLALICNGSCDIQSEKGKGTVVMIHIPKGEYQ